MHGSFLKCPLQNQESAGTCAGAQVAAAPRAALRIEFGDLVEQPQLALGQRRCAMRGGTLEALTEAQV